MGKKKKKKKEIEISYETYNRIKNNKGKLGKLKNDDAVAFFEIMTALDNAFEGVSETEEQKTEEYDIQSLQGKTPKDMSDKERKQLQDFNKEMRSIQKQTKTVELPHKLNFSMLKSYKKDEDGNVFKDEDGNADGGYCFNSFEILDIFAPIIDMDN